MAIVRTDGAWNRCVPCRSPPTRSASPRTSRVLARIEPISAVWTTTTSPAWSAKIEMNSSGRLPSADWRIPVAPGPNRWPSWSVPCPIRTASVASAMALTRKTAVWLTPRRSSTNAATLATKATASVITVVRPRMAANLRRDGIRRG